MSSGQNAGMEGTKPLPASARLGESAAGKYSLVSWACARESVNETVATRVHFDSAAQAIWDELMFYEEVPGRAPFLLRVVLPEPLRTEGDKTQLGKTVRCVYSGGAELVKRITNVEAPRLLRFEVIEQRLGIEDCIRTVGGSYQIHACGDAYDVVLTTNYEARLCPRSLWRPLEAALVKELHRHILRGLNAAVRSRNEATRSTIAAHAPESNPAGGLACTISQSGIHR
jgi:hypothetical protein